MSSGLHVKISNARESFIVRQRTHAKSLSFPGQRQCVEIYSLYASQITLNMRMVQVIKVRTNEYFHFNKPLLEIFV